MNRPVSADCIFGPRAAHDSGPRTADQIAFHIVHSAEGITAEGVADYLHDPSSRGSVQRCVDDKTCIRILPDDVIPWGAPPLNTAGIHDELASYSSWKPSDWYRHHRMLQREAWRIARDCWVYQIPLRWLTWKDLQRLGPCPGKGNGGVTDHYQITLAFHETDHTDPGAGFELNPPKKISARRLLMWYAHRYLKMHLALDRLRSRGKI